MILGGWLSCLILSRPCLGYPNCLDAPSFSSKLRHYPFLRFPADVFHLAPLWAGGTGRTTAVSRNHAEGRESLQRKEDVEPENPSHQKGRALVKKPFSPSSLASLRLCAEFLLHCYGCGYALALV